MRNAFLLYELTIFKNGLTIVFNLLVSRTFSWAIIFTLKFEGFFLFDTFFLQFSQPIKKTNFDHPKTSNLFQHLSNFHAYILVAFSWPNSARVKCVATKRQLSNKIQYNFYVIYDSSTSLNWYKLWTAFIIYNVYGSEVMRYFI